jgi:hypothetical protein
MSAPQPTPGPWSVSGDGKILGPRDGCSHVIIAAMPVWWSNQSPGSHASQDVQAANAALIAHAPDLIAEVERLRAALTIAQNDCDTIAADLCADTPSREVECQAQLLAGVAAALRAALNQ